MLFLHQLKMKKIFHIYPYINYFLHSPLCVSKFPTGIINPLLEKIYSLLCWQWILTSFVVWKSLYFSFIFEEYFHWTKNFRLEIFSINTWKMFHYFLVCNNFWLNVDDNFIFVTHVFFPDSDFNILILNYYRLKLTFLLCV